MKRVGYCVGMNLRSLTAVLVSAAAVSSAAGQATTNPTGDGPRESERYEPRRERDAAGNVLGPARAGWWNDRVFYEIFVRSFADSTDGPLANDGVGDLRGLISRLDYLNDGDPATDSDLGITGIWLMPVTESPSYHGYDVTDYRAIDREYGTIDDFRELVKQCHARGIAVIIDLVMNHTSSRNPWFVESIDPNSAKRDWYIWSDTDPGYKGPWNQRVWHRPRGGSGAGSSYYYGLFGADMPEVNFRNTDAGQAMLDIVKYWLAPEGDGGAGVRLDGYRLDAVRHLIEEGRKQDNTRATHEWLKSFRERYKGVNPEAMCIGEIWAPSRDAASYVGDQMDLAFEFDLAQAIVDSARTGDASRVSRAQQVVLRCYPPGQYGRFTTNHDQPRLTTQLKGDSGAARTAAAMLLLGPGVPFLYYGEEIGMTGDKPDPDIRTPMQWSNEANAGFSTARPWRSVNKDYQHTNVRDQSGEEGSLLQWHQALIRARASSDSLRWGAYSPITTTSPAVYAFARTIEHECCVVVINLGTRDVEACALSAPSTGLTGELKVQHVFPAVGADRDPPAAPNVDDRGGFAAWIPVPRLSPHDCRVFRLTSR